MAALFLLIAAVVLRRSGVGPLIDPDLVGEVRLTVITLAGTLGVAALAVVAGCLPWNRPARGHDAWSRSARRTRWVCAVSCAWLAGCVLGLGWLDLVRQHLGDWVLLDEVVTIAPTIAAMLIAWWAHEPFARQHAPPQARVGFVFTQARILLPLLLVPVGTVLATQEIVERVVHPQGITAEIIGVAAAIMALLISPALVVPALSTAPLPAHDQIDERVRALFATHRIRVRGVRLWNTNGTMMNGVALGLLPWCRWVLLTDALVDGMHPDETLAVAGHEAGHLRHRHAAWLAAACIGGIGCAGIAIGTLIEWCGPILPQGAWIEWAAMVLLLVMGLGFFGIVSRCCERQADAFAVRALSTNGRLAPEAVHAMRRALAVVAFANGIPPRRLSFRHGSIDGRRRRLAAIVGVPFDAIPIDRDMRIMKILIAAALLVTIVTVVLEPDDEGGVRMIPATETRP